MIKSEISIPLYGGLLVILLCEDWSILKEAYALKQELSESNDGYVFTHEGNFIAAFQKAPSPGFIAHEVIHLVNEVYIDRCISLDPHNDEPQAYLAEWFFEQIETFFKF